MERISYHFLDGFPVRLREAGPGDVTAEWIRRDGSTSPADPYKVVVDGRCVPEDVALTFWEKFETPAPNRRGLAV